MLKQNNMHCIPLCNEDIVFVLSFDTTGNRAWSVYSSSETSITCAYIYYAFDGSYGNCVIV